MGVETAVAVVGAIAGIANAQSQKEAQQDAAKKASDLAKKQAREADIAMNRANQKQPDSAAILSAMNQAGKAGASGTMLTGPQGVDPSAMSLGKSTLLGA